MGLHHRLRGQVPGALLTLSYSPSTKGGIRTPDHRLWRPALSQAELPSCVLHGPGNDPGSAGFHAACGLLPSRPNAVQWIKPPLPDAAADNDRPRRRPGLGVSINGESVRHGGQQEDRATSEVPDRPVVPISHKTPHPMLSSDCKVQAVAREAKADPACTALGENLQHVVSPRGSRRMQGQRFQPRGRRIERHRSARPPQHLSRPRGCFAVYHFPPFSRPGLCFLRSSGSGLPCISGR